MGHTPENAMEFEEMPFTKPGAKKKAVVPQKSPKIAKYEKVIKMNKDQYKKAKADHKIAIAKIKAQRAALKADIKKHKLLMKQAKITYKLTKMKAEAK